MCSIISYWCDVVHNDRQTGKGQQVEDNMVEEVCRREKARAKENHHVDGLDDDGGKSLQTAPLHFENHTSMHTVPAFIYETSIWGRASMFCFVTTVEASTAVGKYIGFRAGSTAG